MMNSNIDQEVIDELIAMLEDHIAGGLQPKAEEAPAMDAKPEESIPGVEASEAPAEDDEDMKKLMEMYSRG
jgi:hypothetical protein